MSEHLYPFQFQVTPVEGKPYEIEFIAATIDKAVQAIANREATAGRPVAEIVTGDGRQFVIDQQ